MKTTIKQPKLIRKTIRHPRTKRPRKVMTYGIRHKNPYQLGTTQADAFFTGTDEGHRIATALERNKRKEGVDEPM